MSGSLLYCNQFYQEQKEEETSHSCKLTNLKMVCIYGVILVHLLTEDGDCVSNEKMSDVLSQQVINVCISQLLVDGRIVEQRYIIVSRNSGGMFYLILQTFCAVNIKQVYINNNYYVILLNLLASYFSNLIFIVFCFIGLTWFYFYSTVFTLETMPPVQYIAMQYHVNLFCYNNFMCLF